MPSEFMPVDMPLSVKWYGEPTAKARAFGLDIVLPDPDDLESPYADSWREDLKGEVAMSPKDMDAYDPDWVRLKDYDHGVALWYDLEVGVVFECRVGTVHHVARLIREAADGHGLVISPNDEMWSGRVHAWLGAFGGSLPEPEECAPHMIDAGFAPYERASFIWTLNP